MYGRVTKYFHDRGYGFILGEDRETYFIHHSNLDDEYIAKGYSVYFKPFQNERSDYNAEGVIVIETPEKRKRVEAAHNKKKNCRKRKPCNADRVLADNKKFNRFVKAFFAGQGKMKEPDGNGRQEPVYKN